MSLELIGAFLIVASVSAILGFLVGYDLARTEREK